MSDRNTQLTSRFIPSCFFNTNGEVTIVIKETCRNADHGNFPVVAKHFLGP